MNADWLGHRADNGIASLNDKGTGMTRLWHEEYWAAGCCRGAARFGAIQVLEERRTSSCQGLASGGRVCEMPLSFRSVGGVSAAVELSQLLHRTSDQSVSLLASRIVHGRVVYFEWQCSRWLPLFQFNFARMEMRSGGVPSRWRASRRLRRLGKDAMVCPAQLWDRRKVAFRAAGGRRELWAEGRRGRSLRRRALGSGTTLESHHDVDS